VCNTAETEEAASAAAVPLLHLRGLLVDLLVEDLALLLGVVHGLLACDDGVRGLRGCCPVALDCAAALGDLLVLGAAGVGLLLGLVLLLGEPGVGGGGGAVAFGVLEA
jgi:hypothetical protein